MRSFGSLRFDLSTGATTDIGAGFAVPLNHEARNLPPDADDLSSLSGRVREGAGFEPSSEFK